MKPKRKQSEHAYDTWPPPPKKEAKKEAKDKKRLPRNVNYVDWDKVLLGEAAPVYDAKVKIEPAADHNDEEKEDKDEEREHEEHK